jgi:hypothetical protein
MAVVKVNFEALAKIQGDMNNTDFMETIGMDGSLLYRIKRGGTEPGSKFIANLLDKYGVSFDDVFYLDES